MRRLARDWIKQEIYRQNGGLRLRLTNPPYELRIRIDVNIWQLALAAAVLLNS
jgi:hypothetical protein